MQFAIHCTPARVVAEEKVGCSPHTMTWSVGGAKALSFQEKASPFPTSIAAELNRDGWDAYNNRVGANSHYWKGSLAARSHACLPCPTLPSRAW